jgi:GT2 family glycosyltransferase/2-polyprenyl-3-methyl-5-hydroxy-6-metoxy-1,4-benzoquinol methylase
LTWTGDRAAKSTSNLWAAPSGCQKNVWQHYISKERYVVMANAVDGNFRLMLPSEALEFTGERMTTAIEGQIEFEHFHRYCIARDLCFGLEVLDVASGEGYGSAILAGVSRSVTGVDIDEGVITHARKAYQLENLRFLRGSAIDLPIDGASVDVVVSFETLEHFADHERFALEVRRVLRPGGLFIVSTPDRTVYSARLENFNQYHLRELTGAEFDAYLGVHFKNVAVFYQRPIIGSLVAVVGSAGRWRSYERRAQQAIEASDGLARAPYLIGIASDADLPLIGPSVYVDRHGVEEVLLDFRRVPVLRAQADERTRERDEARAALAEAERLADERTRERDAARADAYQARRTKEAVINSTSWRALAPLRAVVDHFPMLARVLRAADRFKRSATKRIPRRFKNLLTNGGESRRPAQSELCQRQLREPLNPETNARRILVADYRIPRPDFSAGDRATVGILKDLCALGYDVTFVPHDMKPARGYENDLKSVGVNVVTEGSGYKNAKGYIEYEGRSFGTFYIFRVDVAEDVLPVARRVAPAARIIFHAPDLYFLREAREAELSQNSEALANARRTRDRELAIMRSADRVVLQSPAELPFVRSELPEVPISVFPALYASVSIHPPGFSSRRDILFLGGFRHAPNVSGVLWFAENVWPLVRATLRDARFMIVGAEMPASILDLASLPGVNIVGYVSDLDPTLNTTRVSVAPLLYGAGIKGKVAVTMGAGVPCVCTTIAAEGMGIVDGVHARVADDPSSFADAVVSLYTDEALWNRISASGRALVDERFGGGANRASLLSVMNDARALPITLFIDHCSASAPTPLPAYHRSIVPDVSIIVPVCNKWPLTRACLNSVALTSADSGVRYEVILADDGSTDETAKAAELYPGLRVVKTPTNLGFLRNCNNAASQAHGRNLLLLNNDTIVLPGWLKALYQAIESDPDIAIAGSKLLYPDGHVQEAGAALFRDGSAVNVGRGLERDAPVVNIPREVDYISAASIIVRADFWKAMGGFDERYKNAYCEDSDLSMSARAQGKYVWYQPASEVIHFEHQTYLDQAPSHNAGLQRHNIALLLEKWRDVFARDYLAVQAWPVAAANAERRVPPSAMARRQTGKFNILYFSPFPSYPSNHGNAATIQQFGRRFQSLGHKVHFALLQSGMYDDAAVQAMSEEWDTFDILNNVHPLVADRQKIPFDSWYHDGLGENIRVLCAQYDIDVVFCSYIFQSKLLEYVPSHILKVIDTHDKMGGRYDMLRANGQPIEFFSCSPEEEGAYLRRADLVVARREEEARYFNCVTGRNSAIVIPYFEEPHFIKKRFDQLANVGLVASPNRINLAIVKEFLEIVARQCGNECPFTVNVAGQVKNMVEELPRAEAKTFQAPWVRLHGFVPDIGSFYREMDAIVSPITMGTGINVKTVQAMAFGMPLLTTRWGGKGIETDEPMHNYPDVDSLVRGLLSVAKRPEELDRLAQVSRDRYKMFYHAAFAGIAFLFGHKKLTDVETQRLN